MKKLIIPALIFFFLLFPRFAFADSNFLTDYSIVYQVLPTTTTHVTINGSLTNRNSQSYVTSYKIQFGFKDVLNLKANDSSGPIVPNVERNSSSTSVQVGFNKSVLGIGNRQNFSISFDTNEITQTSGQLWEVNIPGLSNQSDFNTFNVKVFYPTFLGSPVYTKPYFQSALSGQSGNMLSFSKEDLGKSGISIAFGKNQIYSFDLKYHLRNTNLFPVQTEIALPSDTNYQKIEIDKMTPIPDNVRIDEDGNWLAMYQLSPSVSADIEVIGKARVGLNPTKQPLDKKMEAEYLKPKPYWESNLQINELASKLKTPMNIYQYVVGNLNYDYKKSGSGQARLGAAAVLKNPNSAVCLEFTDLFIAMARAAGIPAREVDGYAYTNNSKERPISVQQDILHAWPEYYDKDKQAWVMVDPTWGNTTDGVDYFNTFDFDHIAFVVKGENSSYPVPAGGYKSDQTDGGKDVNVELTDQFTESESNQIFYDFSEKNLSFIPVNGSIRIKNTGNVVSKPSSITVETLKLSPNSRIFPISSIPPFGSVTLNVVFDKTPVLTNMEDTITIQSEKGTYSKKIKIAPYNFSDQIILGGLIIASTFIILSIIAFATRRLLISGRKE